MEAYEFTKKKLARERNAHATRLAMIGLSGIAGFALGALLHGTAGPLDFVANSGIGVSTALATYYMVGRAR